MPSRSYFRAMSKFTPGFFDSIYQAATPPWEIGAAQPALSALLDEYPPAGPVLDVGCGTGDLAIELARRGLTVLGVDVVEAAIEEAREKAAALPPEVARLVELRVGDALRPSLLGRRFGAVVDSGFFHVIEPERRDAFVDELANVLHPRGRYYLLAFAIEFDLPNTPYLVAGEEVHARFTPQKGWRVLTVRPAHFESSIAPVPAVAACVERYDSPS